MKGHHWGVPRSQVSWSTFFQRRASREKQEADLSLPPKLESEAGPSLWSGTLNQGPLAWVRLIKILLNAALRVQWDKEKPVSHADTWSEGANWKKEVEEREGWGKGGGRGRGERQREEADGDGDPRTTVQVYILSQSTQMIQPSKPVPAPCPRSRDNYCR